MRSINSPQNSYIKHLIKLAEDKGYRYQVRKVLLEGKKIIDDIVKHMPEATILSISQDVRFPSEQMILISESVARALSQTEHSEGIFAEVTLPSIPMPNKLNRLLVLDNVSDPGNLGTLLRTCIAFNWQAAFFLPGCCDPFNNKALRASQGALFTLPAQKGSWSDLKKIRDTHHLTPFAADINGVPFQEVTVEKMLLVLGNEGQGLSSEAHQLCQMVTIPISHKVESLNVAAAGAILMQAWRLL